MKNPYMKYLAYGSNLHPIRLTERVPSARFIKVIRLVEYKLMFHKLSKDKSGKCNCLYTGKKTDYIWGAIYELKSDEIVLLDEAEGLGRGYDKKLIVFPSNGTNIEVFTYIANSEYIDDTLVPYDWYKQLVHHGAKSHNAPEQYVESINSIQAIKDPNENRSKQNFEIIDKITKQIR